MKYVSKLPSSVKLVFCGFIGEHLFKYWRSKSRFYEVEYFSDVFVEIGSYTFKEARLIPRIRKYFEMDVL